jgi:hypothetical protein
MEQVIEKVQEVEVKEEVLELTIEMLSKVAGGIGSVLL